MQYGTKGEGRDGATGGLPNGGEGGQAAEAAAEAAAGKYYVNCSNQRWG